MLHSFQFRLIGNTEPEELRIEIPTILHSPPPSRSLLLTFKFSIWIYCTMFQQTPCISALITAFVQPGSARLIHCFIQYRKNAIEDQCIWHEKTKSLRHRSTGLVVIIRKCGKNFWKHWHKFINDGTHHTHCKKNIWIKPPENSATRDKFIKWQDCLLWTGDNSFILFSGFISLYHHQYIHNA